ncbi:MAG: TOBE domain-containing protein [Thiobacillus sp.]
MTARCVRSTPSYPNGRVEVRQKQGDYTAIDEPRRWMNVACCDQVGHTPWRFASGCGQGERCGFFFGQLAAIITNESVENLALKPGVEAYALIKAPWVILTTDDSLKTSARNRLCGTVVRCQEGAVNGEVIIELPGGKTVTAIITNDSIQSLGLKKGIRACALIKASHIILAVAA